MAYYRNLARVCAVLVLSFSLTRASQPAALAEARTKVESSAGARDSIQKLRDRLETESADLSAAIEKERKRGNPKSGRIGGMMARSKELAQKLNHLSSELLKADKRLERSLEHALAEFHRSSGASGTDTLAEWRVQWEGRLRKLRNSSPTPLATPDLTPLPSDDVYSLQQKALMLETWVVQLHSRDSTLAEQHKNLVLELENIRNLRDFARSGDQANDWDSQGSDAYLAQDHEMYRIELEIKAVEEKRNGNGAEIRSAKGRLLEMQKQLGTLLQ